MKRVIIIAILFLTAVLVTPAAMGAQAGQADQPDYRFFEDLQKLIEGDDTDYVLVDVRTPEEYRQGHIPGAVNIPYDIIGENLPSRDKDATVIVYCRSGRRSGIAEKTLEDAGFTDVHDFGGIDKWRAPLEK